MNFNINKNFSKINFINNAKDNIIYKGNTNSNININRNSNIDSNSNINNNTNINNFQNNREIFSLYKRLHSLSSTKKNIENKSNNKHNNGNYIDSSIKYIYIYTTKYTENIAQQFKKYFISMDVETSIYIDKIEVDHISMCKNNPNLYFFIISPQIILMHDKFELPKNKYILYQTEQYNQPNMPKISDTLIQDCYTIYDYSNINLKYYNKNFVKNIKILTPLIDSSFLSQNITFDKDIDILFIGTINERRKKILEKLDEWCKNNNYNIKIVSNIFGDELIKIINKSKLIINLHYYDNAILEVFRLHDILPYSCQIISENPGNEEEMDLVEKYGNVISFFPVIDDDLSNIDNMFTIINDKLDHVIDFDERKGFIEEVNENNNITLNNNYYLIKYLQEKTTQNNNKFIKPIKIDLSIPVYHGNNKSKRDLMITLFKYLRNISNKLFEINIFLSFTILGSDKEDSLSIFNKYLKKNELDIYIEFNQGNNNYNYFKNDLFKMLHYKFYNCFLNSWKKPVDIFCISGSNDFIDINFYIEIANKYNSNINQLYGLNKIYNATLITNTNDVNNLCKKNIFFWNLDYGENENFKGTIFAGGILGISLNSLDKDDLLNLIFKSKNAYNEIILENIFKKYCNVETIKGCFSINYKINFDLTSITMIEKSITNYNKFYESDLNKVFEKCNEFWNNILSL